MASTTSSSVGASHVAKLANASTSIGPTHGRGFSDLCAGQPIDKCTAAWPEHWFWIVLGITLTILILLLLFLCLSDAVKRLFKNRSRTVLVHYVALGYTINNVVLYGNGLWVLAIWLTQRTSLSWTMSTEVPAIILVASLCFCFMISNWKSYYKVIDDYLTRSRKNKKTSDPTEDDERLMRQMADEQERQVLESANPVSLSQQSFLFVDRAVDAQPAPHHPLNVQGRLTVPIDDASTISSSESPHRSLDSISRSRVMHSVVSNRPTAASTSLSDPSAPPSEKKSTGRCMQMPVEALDRVFASGGSILKAIASSAAWFTWVDQVTGNIWLATASTIFFAPACTISQIAFLSLGSSSNSAKAKQKNHQDKMEEDEVEPLLQSVPPTPTRTKIRIHNWDNTIKIQNT